MFYSSLLAYLHGSFKGIRDIYPYIQLYMTFYSSFRLVSENMDLTTQLISNRYEYYTFLTYISLFNLEFRGGL